MQAGDIETGMFTGTWYVPEDGFVLDNGLEESAFGFGNSLPTGTPCLRYVNPEGYGRRYPVMRENRVLRDFVELARNFTPDRVVAYADRWGALGVQAMMDDVTTDESGHRSGKVIPAESLYTWENEALRLLSLYETWEAVYVLLNRYRYSRDAVRKAAEFLRSRVIWRADGNGVGYTAITTAALDIEATIPTGPPNSGAEEQSTPPGPGSQWAQIAHHGFQPEVWARLRRARELNELEGTIEAARYFVCREVNDRLRGGVHLAVQPFRENQMRFYPDSLLAAIYFHFAAEVSNRQGREIECEHCRSPFLPRRKGQRYCGKNCRELHYYHTGRRSGTSKSEGG